MTENANPHAVENPPMDATDMSNNNQETFAEQEDTHTGGKYSSCPLAEALEKTLTLTKQPNTVTETSDRSTPPTILCDFGYGLPKEARPRKEKLLAIARQLVNFLHWQGKQKHNPTNCTNECCLVKVVACDEPELLEQRMLQLWTNEKDDSHKDNKTKQRLPENFSISNKPLEAFCSTDGDGTSALPVYLSPDAPTVLDPSEYPPKCTVVGLIIDRRTIQVNRSVQRANKLELPTARWSLDCVSDVLDPHEPLNVDCVLEGMQQWHWNTHSSNSDTSEQHYQSAVIGALKRHQERHPERPQHKLPPS